MRAGISRTTIAVLLLAGAALAACSRTDEASAIAALIAEGVEQAQAHDLGGLEDLTTADFIAEPGSYPWAEAKRFVFLGMKRYGNFRIHYPQPSIDVSEDRRRATATVHFLIVDKERPFPELQQLYDDPVGWLAAVNSRADLYTLALELRSDDGDWRVYRARLTRFSGLQGEH